MYFSLSLPLYLFLPLLSCVGPWTQIQGREGRRLIQTSCQEWETLVKKKRHPSYTTLVFHSPVGTGVPIPSYWSLPLLFLPRDPSPFPDRPTWFVRTSRPRGPCIHLRVYRTPYTPSRICSLLGRGRTHRRGTLYESLRRTVFPVVRGQW